MKRHRGGRFDIRFLARALAVAGTALAVSVCGEQGPFGGTTGPGADTEKPVVRVDLGPTDTLVEIADSLKFTLTVTDNARLATVHVGVSGLEGFVLAGVFNDTISSGTLTLFTKTYAVALPANAAGQRIAITVSAKDASNNEGVGGDTVRVNDAVAPVVTLVTPAAGPVYVGAGDTIAVLAKAVDPSGVRSLGARLFVRDTVLQSIVTLAQASQAYTSRSTLRLDSFKVAVPASLQPGSYLLHGFAVDSSPAANAGLSADLVVNVRDVRPPTGSFVSPAPNTQVVAGDSVQVQFRAQDLTGVDSVTFRGYSLRGSALLGTLDTVLRFQKKTARFAPARTDTTATRYLAAAADSIPETVYLEAVVWDVGGNRTPVIVSIQILAGPSVRVSAPVAGVQHAVGTTLNVTVAGSDPHLLAYVGFVATGAVARTDSVAVSPAAASSTQAMAWAVPASAALGAETITPFARNQVGVRFTGAPVVLSLGDAVAPVATIQSPLVGAPVVAGDSVLVRVRVEDNRGLDSILLRGIAHRGNPALGADTNTWRFNEKSISLRGVGLVDTILTRYLLPVLTDSTAETIYLVVRVWDTEGNVRAESVAVAVAPGPYAALVGLQNGLRVPVGTRLPLTVAGYDPDTLAYLGYEASGRFPWRDSIQIVRPVPDAVRAQNTLDFWIPLTSPLGVDTIRPFARDILGGRFYGAPVVVQFVDNSNPLIDIIRPDSGGADAIPSGDSLFVRFRARDNQGVQYVGAFGRWNYPTNGDSTGRHTSFYPYLLQDRTVPGVIDPLEFSKFRVNPADPDTIIRVFLQPTQVLADSAPRTVWIVAFAQDSAGNVGVDSVQLSVTAGAYVRITSPVSPLVHPTATPISVTVTAFDPDSIARVGVMASGVVTGGDSTSYVSPLALTQTTTLTVTVSPTATGAFTVTPFAVDRLGNRRLGTALAVQLADTARPTVTIDTPAVALYPVASGDSVFVRVRVRDNVGVTGVTLTGVARRGSVALGTDTVVTRFHPKTVTVPSRQDTTLTRYLLPDMTQQVSEIVYLIVTAEDSSGSSASDTATIRIVGGPTMTVVRPVTGATTSVGKSVIVQLHGVDANGVRLMGWRATGVLTGQDSAFFSPVSGDLADTATFVDTLVIPALTPLGTFTITPFGLDSLGDVSGTVPGVAITVESSAGDVTPPAVRFQVDRRVEIDDSVTVITTDAGGIRNVGFRVTTLDTTNVLRFDTLGANLNGTLSDVSRTFSLSLPITLRYPSQVIVRGYGTDSTGNKSFSVVAETLTVVAGKTYSLPAGSQIADAIYNLRRRELYLSNYARDRIEVFSLVSNSFVASIPVGSRPWGLAMWPRAHNTTTALATDTIYADTLIVANSGGTNLSIVDLVSRREVRRHRLPNYLVSTLKIVDAGAGGQRLEETFRDFSDRPQYVGAVCRAGGTTGCDSVIAVYSTTPTLGQTIPLRGYVAWENISRTSGSPIGQGHFFWEQATIGPLPRDTVQIIAVRDTMPGEEIRDVIIGGAAGELVTLDRLAFQDTTFVRNSGNFLRVLIGEGGGGLALARVMAYDATAGDSVASGRQREVVTGVFLDSTARYDRGISSGIHVRDFIGNRASSVTSIATNFTGATNLVRADSIYVFNSILRQTGMLQVSGDAHGMDVAPLHAFSADDRGTNTVPGDGDADARIVFAARPDSSIDVFDTYFFGEVTDTAAAGVPIPIRNALVGSVRMTPDSGGTVLVGVTNQGLVVVRLPTLVNPFMAPAIPMPTVALPGTAPARPAGRVLGTSPPNE